MFISMIPMIFIFGFDQKYLLEKKLGHFEKSFRTRVEVTTPTLGSVINLRAFFKALGRGGVIIRPLFLGGMERGDPTFQSIEQNVFCNISATTIPNLDFNSAFERPDP